MVVLKSADLPSRPFCSSRCKMVDLYKWLNEDIIISEEIPNGGMTIPEEETGA